MKILLNYSAMLIVGILGSFQINAQSSEFLDINNVKARIDANTILSDQINSGPSYEVPSGSGIHSIYAASLWLAGKDPSGIIKTNVNTYYNASQPIQGPIMTPSFYSSTGATWNKVWKIQCQEVQTFVAWYQAGIDDALNGTTTQATNFPGYTIPTVILNWPAHGDISLGQDWHLAPFFDRDGDNFYDPNQGDYPLVKGDETIYFIYNDERPFYDGTDTHTPMKTEVHGMAYAFASSDVALNNTVFLNYKIYNRSNINYDSCYVGFWADFDLGNSTDDFIASDVERSSFYIYNGDSFDEDANGFLGYGANLPAQSITFLKGAKQNNDGLDNPFTLVVQDALDSNGTPYECLGAGYGDGTVDNEYLGLQNFISYSIGAGQFSGDGSPITEADYYNYLKGNWRDGTQMVYGGNGNIGGGGTIPTNHLYPGSSDPLFWSTQGIPASPSNWSGGGVPGDKTGVGSSGPFTLLAGSSIEIDLALIFGQDLTGAGPQAGVAVMQERIDSICSYFKNGITTDCNAGGVITGITTHSQKENTLTAYPNPFNNELTINYELQNNSAQLEIYNLIGEQIKTQTLTEKSTIIDLSLQPSGIYFVAITDGTNRVSRKIIKQ
jgi:hypothetical protein